MPHEETLLKPGLELLTHLRADRSAWARVCYEPEVQAPNGRRDRNALSRLQLAWALEHAFEQADSALLRFALEEEVKWREEDPWQGIGETLEILGALTARQRDLQDVWMLARAKRANFDTGCGFDRRYLFAAGVRETVVYVQASNHPDRAEVLEILLDEQGEPCCDELEVNAWLESRPDQMPLDENARLRVWFERALAVGRRDIASSLLDACMQQGSRDEASLRSYAYDLEALERWPEASQSRKERFPLLEDPFDKAGEAREIARLERLAKQPEEAERWLLAAAELHADNVAWREVGLARMFVEECFRCAIALGAERGAKLFAVGDGFAQTTPRLPLVALEAAVEAAKLFQSPRLSHYERARAKEARRIEKLSK